jgi:HEAT repeat protein
MRGLLSWSVAVLALGGLSSPGVAGADQPRPVEEWQIRGILRALQKDEYPRVRAYAAEKLKDLIDKSSPEGAARPDWEPGLFGLAQEARESLRDLLKEPDRAIRAAAAAALGRVGGADDVPALRELLKDTDRDVRAAAAAALGRVGGAGDVPALRELLKDPNWDIRAAAAAALGRVGGEAVVPALRELLKDPNHTVSLSAAQALACVGGATDVPALRRLLKDPNRLVRAAAAVSLARVGGADDVPALRELLKDPDPPVRVAALQALARVGGATDVPALRELLKDPDPSVRVAALQAVVHATGKAAEPYLRELLNDPDPLVHGAAVVALIWVGAYADAPALRQLLKDPSAVVRRAAAEELERMGETRPIAALAIVYEDASRLDEFRWLARYWGGKRPDESEILCDYLAHPTRAPEPPASRAEAREVIGAFLSAWDELDHLPDLDSRSIREDIARWWSSIITGQHRGWEWQREDKGMLRAVRDRLTSQEATAGRGYAPGIERVIDRYEFWPTPEVRTVIAFLALNLLALVLYRLSLALGGLTKWLPFAAWLLGGVGLSLTDVTYYYPAHTKPWLLATLLLVEFAALVGAGILSSRVLRHVALVKPFDLVFPLALRLPSVRRRFFADYVQRLRQQIESDRSQAADEKYAILPADVRDDRNATATLCADPAADVLKFLAGTKGSTGHVLIEATGGTGKSALIREVVSRALAAFETDPGRKPLPVRLTGQGDSIEKMLAEALGATLVLPELLPQHLEAGDFFLVLDGVSESGLSDKVLAAFLNGPHAATSVLLASRPAPEFRRLIEGTPRWMTLEPRRLDEASLDVFVAHYGGRPLPTPVKAACRGPEGTYLPLWVRMAMLVNTDAGAVVSVADIYREHFLRVLAGRFPEDRERLRLLDEAARWCLETYWKDGQRARRYEATELQRVLLQAGLLVRDSGTTVANEVRFFHDSYQSYLTACGLSAEDGQGGERPPFPAEDGDGSWDRRRVLFRAAGDPSFVGAHSELVLSAGSELFQMILATTADKPTLRQCLRTELEAWANEHHQDLRLRDFQSALPQAVADNSPGLSNKELLTRAAEAAFEADTRSDTAAGLGALYGCLAPLVYSLRERRGRALRVEFAQLWGETASQPATEDRFLEQAAKTARLLCRALGLALKGEIPVCRGRCAAFLLDMGSLFSDLRLHQTVPLVFLRSRELAHGDQDDLRGLLQHLLPQPGSFALLALFTERESLVEVRRLLDQQLRQIYAMDVVVLDKDRIPELLGAQDGRLGLRKLVLSEVDLVNISPYTTTGPTPKQTFKGREKELREIVDHARDTSFALIGGRKVGKSSILLRLHKPRLPAAGYRSYYFSCQRMSRKQPTKAEFLAALARRWAPGTPSATPAGFADLLGLLPYHQPLVFLIDEADRLLFADRPAGWPLFGELRALAHEGRCQFVFAGERLFRDAILEDSTGPLYNFPQVKRVGRLEYDEVKELVCRPMKDLEIRLQDEDALVRRVWDATGGHPNVVQRLCKKLIERLNADRRRHLTPADVEAVLNDPHFQRYDFLGVFWEQATVLERIVSLALPADGGPRNLKQVRAAVKSRAGFLPPADETDGALLRLTELRSILASTPEGYDFAIRSFPEVITRTVTADDALEVLTERFHRLGDVLVTGS